MGGAGAEGPLRTQDDWERVARELLDEGQTFLTHDVCREGLRAYPGSHKLAVFGAIALSQTGAVDEARRLLKPVLDALLVDEGPFRRLEASLRQSIDLAGRNDSEALHAMVELAQSIDMVRGKTLVSTADAETYTSLARVFREAWAASGDRHDLDLCGELSLRAFRANGDSRDGVDAATTAWLRGDSETARQLAAQVRDALLGEHEDLRLPPAVRYRRMANLGQAQLLLDDTEGAIATFHWAAAIEGAGYPPVVSALNKFKLLEEAGKSVPAELYQLVKPPRVVVCTGHPLDRPGEPAHFPPELEAAVRAEIARTLEEIDAQIGYSMAAAGTDLLFIEAMLERGAEVNVVLPFALDDFIAAQVRYAGPRWEMRFRNALKLASTVTYATEERYLGHAMLYRFANQCLHGLATLRSGFLRTSPTLLAVWDMMPGSLVGGAAEFIDQWEDISALRIIDLDGLLQQHPVFAGEAPALPEPDEGEAEIDEGRVIRSMMFCDIAGYSKLKEEHIPIFLDFLDLLHQRLASAGLRPMAVNTWGDAIFAVMAKATPMAEYALTLQEAVTWADEILADRLPHPLNLRISLHAGPVFEAVDPICGRRNFYGSHINRAARLEPVTVIGHVYATQQFVAVLTAEQSALRSEAVNRGESHHERYVSEYVGQLSLAKDFGRQVVYHLRRGIVRTPPPVVIAESADGETAFSAADIAALLEEVVAVADLPEEDAPIAPGAEAVPDGETAFSAADIDALLEEVDAVADLPEEDAPVARPLAAEAAFSAGDLQAILDDALPTVGPAPRAPRTVPQRGDDIQSVLAAVARLIERADGLTEPAGAARVRTKPPPAPPPPPAKPADTDAAARLLDEEVLFPGA